MEKRIYSESRMERKKRGSGLHFFTVVGTIGRQLSLSWFTLVG